MRSMRFWKAVQGEGADVLDDWSCDFASMPFCRHASTEFAFEILHSLPGASHPYGAAQLVRFGTAEIATIIAMRSSCS